MLQLAVFIGVILSFFVYSGTDTYWPPWCLLSFGALSLIGWIYYILKHRRIPLPFLFMFLWIVANGLVLVEYKPALNSPGVEIAQIIALKNLAATVVIETLLLGMVFTNAWLLLRIPLAVGFYLMGLANSVSLIVDQLIYKIPSGTANIGLLGNRSIGASFTVVWLLFVPYFTSTWLKEFHPNTRATTKYICGAIGILAVLVSQSGVSFLALLLGAVAGLGVWWPGMSIGFAVVGISALSLAQIIKPQFWTHISRYDAWPMFLTFWREHFPWWFGSGIGTFKFWGPATQAQEHFMEGRWWMWAHNDWLQILFELGAMGLSLALFLYGYVLVKALRKHESLYATAIGFGVVMIANYPWHIAPFALFGLFLMYETVVGGECAIQVGSTKTEVQGASKAGQNEAIGSRQVGSRDTKRKTTRAFDNILGISYDRIDP